MKSLHAKRHRKLLERRRLSRHRKRVGLIEYTKGREQHNKALNQLQALRNKQKNQINPFKEYNPPN
jgi:hypothetical protein